MKIKIERSACQEFVRVTLNGQVEIIPMSEWSKALAEHGTFRHKDPDTNVEPDCA